MNRAEYRDAATRNSVLADHALDRSMWLRGGCLMVTVRPMGAHDMDYVQSYVRSLSPESRRNRFLGALNELSLAELKRLSNLDRASSSMLIAEVRIAGPPRMIGEARYAMIGDRCEVALSVSDSWQRRGLGSALLEILESCACGLGACEIVAEALYSNEPIKRLTTKFGFTIRPVVGDARLVRMTKTIRPHAFGNPSRALVAA
jgi:GNAT superfamily N-acetyltransferase